MDKRFAGLMGLAEEDAIALLDAPEQPDEETPRYIAAAQLANYPTQSSIDALIRAVKNDRDSLSNRIARRKAIESLGKLKAAQGLSAIQDCLTVDDCYTVEVAAWAIGEMGTQDQEILEAVAQLLETPGQIYRVIIHTLATLDYKPALDRIRKFVDADDEPTASAAISAVCRFTKDYELIDRVVEFLQHSSVNARRACLQDLIDADYHPAIPNIARCPISLVFRLRAIRQLAEGAIGRGELTVAELLPVIDQVLRDNPADLDLVHEYDQKPALAFAIQELYQTDFGRAYLAVKTLVEDYAAEAPQALLDTFEAEAHNDYGAHYHVIKTLGWLKYESAFDLIVQELNNTSPQFQKSRAAAALALGELGDQRGIPLLKESLETNIWTLKYAALMALEQLGDVTAHSSMVDDSDPFVREKAAQILATR